MKKNHRLKRQKINSNRLNLKCRINNEAAYRDIDRETYFLLPEEKKVHIVNESGQYIWRLIRKGRIIGEIIEAFKNRYKRNKVEATKDVLSLLELMRRKKIIYWD